MKISTPFATLVIVASLLFVTTSVQAQTTPSRYKDVVVENPNAEADMKVVGDYTNALIAGDLDKAKSLLSAKYMGRGPARADSSTVDQRIAGWKEGYKTQADRKVSFVTQTFRVLSGNLKGNWVSMWGDYTFSQAGKTITLPFQYTANVADGKIVSDRIYYDNLSVFQQLGFKLTPPETAKK